MSVGWSNLFIDLDYFFECQGYVHRQTFWTTERHTLFPYGKQKYTDHTHGIGLLMILYITQFMSADRKAAERVQQILVEKIQPTLGKLSTTFESLVPTRDDDHKKPGSSLAETLVSDYNASFNFLWSDVHLGVQYHVFV